jgi:oligosaccharide 4-alpha-D-glucosyltransferase
MKRFSKILALSLFSAAGLGSIALAAQSELKEVNGAFEVVTPKGTVSVTPLTQDIFRVTTLPAGSALTYTPSQSAILKAGSKSANSISSKTTPSAFYITSPTTTVRIDRETGAITFHNPQGDLILSEIEGVDNSGKVKRITFEGNAEESFYGAGERGHALNLNGDTLTMFNRQNYGYTSGDPRISQMGISVPYVASDLGYGLLFDDYNEAKLVLGDTITYTSDTPKPLSYYFINGNGNLAGVTEGYTRLTGRQDLPPFWSLGYITSKYGYHNQKEAEGAIDSLKTRGYPVDGMVLDLYWYGVESDMGRLEWDPKQWPDHKKMLADLKEKGVNTVLISQPYVNKKGAIDNYNFLSSKGMLAKDSLGNTHDVTTWVGDAGMIDVSNPETREWLWNRLKGLTEEGVAGWWGDLGEPEVHPRSIVHANGETAPQYHNVYGNEWSRLIYEGLRKDFPDMRPLLMMRGGTAGLQRYSVFPWTTDVSRSWGGLQPQVNLMLSSGLSGLAYMSSDLGGFAVDPEHPTDEELYLRWVQMGAFTPSMRTHAQTMPEPYHYPAIEPIVKQFIKMRYEWLPYNYTLAYENATKGWPLARPLNFRGDNPDAKYADITDEYLWGDEVLVAPVMEAGVKERKVLFPAGDWISWYNPALRYKGGTEAVVKTPKEELPMFVRAGSFIPLYMEPIENVTQYNPALLTVRYYPANKETEYVLFDDDRKSPESIADKAYQLTYFTGLKTAKGIDISIRTNGGTYKDMPEVRMLTFEIMDVARPKGVTLSDGTELQEAASLKMIRQYGWTYDAKTRTLSVRFPYGSAPLSLSIKQ